MNLFYHRQEGTLAQNRCNKLQSDMLTLKMLSGWGKNLNSAVLFSMVKWVWISSLRKVIHLNTFSALLYVICDKKTEYFVVIRTWKYCSVQHQNFYWNLKNSLYNMYIISPWVSKWLCVTVAIKTTYSILKELNKPLSFEKVCNQHLM